MNPRQFVILLQMLDAIRCQLGTIATKGEARQAEYSGRAEALAELAIKDAQYRASLPPE